ncbi:MAG: SPASM domain-containing protein [Candidatus Tritonobacter lacicola]|nr:SPASM domain-containing protein [Candidatus Tritonobacter lacicola]
MMHEARKFLRCLFKRVSVTPEEVQVEITNRCNFTCAMCPREALGVDPVDMDFSLFERIAANMGRPRTVVLTGWGEPLLHPRLLDMVKLVMLGSPRAGVRLTTNGYLLEGGLARGLVEVGVHQVSISMEGESTIGHTAHEKVKENAACFAAMRPRVRSVGLQVVMADEEAVQGVVRFALEADMDFVNLVRVDRTMNDSLPKLDAVRERELVGRCRRIASGSGLDIRCANFQSFAVRLAGHFDRYCLRTDSYVYVNVEGDVSPCCLLRAYKCGSLVDREIKEIWHGEGFARFRRSYPAGICSKCDMVKYNIV